MTVLPNQAYLEAAIAAVAPHQPLLESIREINLRFLNAVREAQKSASYEFGPELGMAAPTFRSLDATMVEAAARFPFLLMDLGMSAAGTVASLVERHGNVRDRESNTFHTEHVAIARSALVLGWHVARTDSAAALLLFEFSPVVVRELANLPLHRVEALAPMCVSPLALRWRTNARLWRELLSPDAYASVDTVRGFVMHAVGLTATTHLS